MLKIGPHEYQLKPWSKVYIAYNFLKPLIYSILGGRGVGAGVVFKPSR